MRQESLYLRTAEPSDVDMLFALANDETVRKNSFCTDPISYDDHKGWFRKMMADDSRMQYILMSGSRAVGQIRLTVDGSSAEIGYSIIPDVRGMGYGRRCIGLLLELVHNKYPGIKKLTARVKPENAASIYCFEENGFREAFQYYEFGMEDYKAETGTFAEERMHDTNGLSEGECERCMCGGVPSSI